MAERFWLGKIENLAQKLPEIDSFVSMATGVDQKALHNYILHKCKEQTMVSLRVLELVNIQKCNNSLFTNHNTKCVFAISTCFFLL